MTDGKVLRVGVLMGGVSPEHPVSLVSGTGMLKNLDPARFRGFPILISRSGEWLWPGDGAVAPFDAPEQAAAIFASPPAGWHRARFPEFGTFPRCDIMLIGLHGVGGEDGSLQGFLDLAGQAYTGSGMLGSALSMDKIKAKEIYRAVGIPTGRSRVLKPEAWPTLRAVVEKEFGYPVVIKNPLGGSSIGVGIAKDGAELDALLPGVSRARTACWWRSSWRAGRAPAGTSPISSRFRPRKSVRSRTATSITKPNTRRAAPRKSPPRASPRT